MKRRANALSSRQLARLASLALLSLAVQSRAQARSDRRCFPEPGLYTCGRIRGLPMFGYPIALQRTEPTPDGTFESQWFERTRLELHSEHAPPYDVLIVRAAGVHLQQPGRGWQAFAKNICCNRQFGGKSC